MRIRDKKTVYKRGSRISVYIKKDVSDDFLSWINNQKYAGPAIVDILNLYANGKLISIDAIKQLSVDSTNEKSKTNNKTQIDYAGNEPLEIDMSKDNSYNIQEKKVTVEIEKEKESYKHPNSDDEKLPISTNLAFSDSNPKKSKFKK